MTAFGQHILEGFAEALRSLLVDGFEPPLYWAAMGTNGSIIAGEYQPGPGGTLISDITVQHIVGGGLATPVNVMFTDSAGRAASLAMGLQPGEVDG